MKKRYIAMAMTSLLMAAGALYIADDYYSAELLGHFEEAKEDCFRKKKPVSAKYASEMTLSTYHLFWHTLDNKLPSVSEILAPSPELGNKITAKEVLETDFYYDAWAGKIIKID